MLSQYVSQWKNRMQDRVTSPLVAPRRVSHGGSGWLHEPAVERQQPQDGAPFDAGGDGPRQRVAEMPVSWMEPEDARLTGGTRSLMRRLMGLNMSRPAAAAAKPVGAAKIAAKAAQPGKRKAMAVKGTEIQSAPEQAA